MSDLISRQAAIVECNKRGAEHIGYAIAHLPTVQPEKAQLSQEGTTSDLISREAVIDLLKQMRKDGDMVPWEGKDVFARIRKLPTAQPEPQEGHWIRTDCGLDVECKCSKCGYKDFVEPGDEYWFKRNYCPNCGAKMKGERQK